MPRDALAPLLTPSQHVALLHPVRGGCVPLAVVSPGTGWGERAVRWEHAGAAADMLAGVADVYVGQQGMRGGRAVARIHALGALYLDLDTRKVPRLARLAPEAVADLVLARAAKIGADAPTLITFTGRGLAATWAHDRLPPAALSRWQRVQDALVEAFRDLGADPAVRDAARVLRLIGSVHGRTGETVRALHVGERVTFDRLADALLPHTRAEIVVLRAEAARRRAEGRERRAQRTDAPRPSLTRTTWAEALLADLHRLHRHRYGAEGAVPQGSRDLWHLALSIAAAWLAPASAAAALVGELGALVGRDHGRAVRRKGTVLRRAQAAAQGQTVAFGGREWDPRYTPRASTVAGWLDVSESEARAAGLRILTTPGLRRERERERWHARREAAGRSTRAAYRDEAAARTARAAELRTEGASWASVAQVLGLTSPDAARKLAARGPDKSLRVTSGVATPEGEPEAPLVPCRESTGLAPADPFMGEEAGACPVDPPARLAPPPNPRAAVRAARREAEEEARRTVRRVARALAACRRRDMEARLREDPAAAWKWWHEQLDVLGMEWADRADEAADPVEAARLRVQRTRAFGNAWRQWDAACRTTGLAQAA